MKIYHSQMNLLRIYPSKTSLTTFFLSLGIFFLGLGILHLVQRYNPRRLSFNMEISSGKNSKQSYPVKITIKRLDIDLPVIPSSIKKGVWETTTKGVSWLSNSPSPGSPGNSILYGHNWTNLLGPLTRIKAGDEIAVKMNNGKEVRLFVTVTATVSPSDISILYPSQKPQVTIYTCAGFLDTRRFVATAQIL